MISKVVNLILVSWRFFAPKVTIIRKVSGQLTCKSNPYLAVFLSSFLMTENYHIPSPDKRILIRIRITDRIYYAVDLDGQNILWYSPLSLELAGKAELGIAPRVQRTTERIVHEEITPVCGTRAMITDHCRELVLKMEGDFEIVFRAYNNGVAYRFRTNFPESIQIVNEEVAYRFSDDHRLVAHVVGDFQTSYEKLYTKYHISEVAEEAFISLPLVVDQSPVKIAITESDVQDYPGMYLMRKPNNNRFDLLGLFPALPTKWETGGLCQFNLRVTERANYLAETDGQRAFPWRIMVIADRDLDLVECNLVYQLARPSVIAKTDWIKPGKVAWDWWNDWNLEGVDFETGVNDQTYRYYIDFASQHRIDYVILDEGWSDQFDLLLQKPQINVPDLVKYARARGVGIVLWCVWHTLDRQMTPALEQFAAWGISGIKVDFIDRDDQIAINFYERVAREAAARNLLVNIHGCSKPTGLSRTYPNVLTFEGVRGNEYNKFDEGQTPGHDVDLVFTRMIAGPMDYTPGAMRNSTKGSFHMNNSNPMSHGTRCHQLAMYVVYFSPMQMLCDAPTAYEKSPDILAFLSQVPVIWDDSKALAGTLGEYVVVARKSGSVWYIGALTDWTARKIAIDLSFVEAESYEGTFFLDGINAHRKAEDYRCEKRAVGKNETIDLFLKPGGGAVVILKP